MYATCSLTVSLTVMLRVTVAEAAKLLGISADGVRMRVRRGTIDHEKDENGRLLVYVDEAELDRNEAQDATADMYLALLQEQIELLRNEVTDWKEQLREEREANRENRRLLAAALERLPPALEAPEKASSEARESPETASESVPYGTSRQEAEDSLQPRSWWRRFFGLE
jgi:DNA-binding transcriptional MerR regulator